MVKSVNAHCSCSSKHKGSLSSAKGLIEKRELRQLAKKKKANAHLCCFVLLWKMNTVAALLLRAGDLWECAPLPGRQLLARVQAWIQV